LTPEEATFPSRLYSMAITNRTVNRRRVVYIGLKMEKEKKKKNAKIKKKNRKSSFLFSFFEE
jgi:hypothetical protein